MCVQGVLLKTGAKSFRVAYQSGGMALPVGRKSDPTPMCNSWLLHGNRHPPRRLSARISKTLRPAIGRFDQKEISGSLVCW